VSATAPPAKGRTAPEKRFPAPINHGYRSLAIRGYATPSAIQVSADSKRKAPHKHAFACLPNNAPERGDSQSALIVAAETYEAPHVLRSDPQIAGRFEQHKLPVWTESQELRQLVAGYLAQLPGEKSRGDR
jgi:hypothetical protein